MAKKKRYHQSMHDRMDESRGMRKEERRMKEDEMHESRGMKRHLKMRELEDRDMYSGYDERRAIEAKDFGMIHEDRHAIANLPQEVMMKPYPRFRYGLDPFLDDTINGVDDQMYADDKQMKRHIGGLKY